MKVRSPRMIFFQGTRWRSDGMAVTLPDSYWETIKDKGEDWIKKNVLEHPDPAAPVEDVPEDVQKPKQAKALDAADPRNAGVIDPSEPTKKKPASK